MGDVGAPNGEMLEFPMGRCWGSQWKGGGVPNENTENHRKSRKSFENIKTYQKIHRTS